jgi:ribosomal protein L37AE/L43A
MTQDTAARAWLAAHGLTMQIALQGGFVCPPYCAIGASSSATHKHGPRYRVVLKVIQWSRNRGDRLDRPYCPQCGERDRRTLSFAYWPSTNAEPTEAEVLKWIMEAASKDWRINHGPRIDELLRERIRCFFTDAELTELSRME